MGLNSCYVILKYIVVTINLIFWVTGLSILALSIWLLTDPSVYIGVTQDNQSFNSGIYVLLAVGLLILIVGILGCCGACRESQCLLISFFCILLIVVAAEIAAGAWAYTNKDELRKLVQVNVQTTVEEEYGVIDSRTTMFDTMQRELQCCGANGPADWANSKFNKKEDKLDLTVTAPVQTYNIPSSCCRGEPEDVLCINGRQAKKTVPVEPIIYSDGCINKLYDYLEYYSPIIIGVAVGIALIEFLGLILSLILCCAVRFVDRYKA